MILSDTQILKAIEKGEIVITPFDKAGLGQTLMMSIWLPISLSIRMLPWMPASQLIEHFEIGPEGFVIQPGELYLGVTVEYTESHCAVPFLEGKSSVGRLGIDIHATAGKGDVGYCNTWTLEISCVKPVRIYANMPIGQLIYFKVEGEIANAYNKKPGAKYNQRTTALLKA
jgi:dCTP deaminase